MGAAPLTALAARWHVLHSGAADGVTNMATDAALMAHARRTGAATLRLYAWDRPTLSLGRHERARGVFDAERIAAARIGLVRRPTGGRALIHHREVTYSVTAPDTAPFGTTYGAINALLLDALARLGVAAQAAAPAGRPLRPEGAPCFAEPAAGELVVAGVKLVGSAQLREDGALLQHGSILLADDQPMLAALRQPVDDAVNAHERATHGVATLEGALGRPVAPDEVARVLIDALGARVRAEPLDPALLRADLARLVLAFADPEWTWRR